MKNLAAEFLSNAVRVGCDVDVYALYQEWEKSRGYVRAAGMLLAPNMLNDDQWSLDLVTFIKTAPFNDLLGWVMLAVVPQKERWNVGALRNAATQRRDTAELAARRVKQAARKAAIKAFDDYRKASKLDYDHPLVVAAAEVQNAALDQADLDYEAACDAIDQAWEAEIRAAYLSLITDTVRYA